MKNAPSPTSSPPRNSKVRSLLGALLAFVVPFGVYLATLCPTVSFGDCGELITASHFLGVAHPTGYPLYCLLGHAFQSVIPFGEYAWRNNLLSAVAAAGACTFVFSIVRRASQNVEVAIGSAWAAAFSSVFWSQAVISEVYTLHIFLLVGTIDRVLAFHDRGKRTDLLLASVFFGLGLAHHLTIVVLGPALLLLLVSKRRDSFKRLTTWLMVACPILLGLSLYAYLLIRSAAEPTGSFRPIDSFDDLLFHVRGGLYQDNLGRGGVEGALANFRAYLQDLHQRFSWPIIVIALSGIASILFRMAWGGFFLAIAWLTYGLFASNYYVFDYEVFFLPADVLFAVFFGLGLAIIKKPRALAAAIALGMSASLGLANFQQNDMSSNRMARAYADNVLETLPEGATLFAWSDLDLPVLAYAHLVENQRPDIHLYFRTQQMLPYVEGSRAMSLGQLARVRNETERRMVQEAKAPVFYTHAEGQPFGLEGLVPRGLVYQVRTRSQSPSPDDGWDHLDLTGVEQSTFALDPGSQTAVVRYLERRASVQLILEAQQLRTGTAEGQLAAQEARRLAHQSMERAVDHAWDLPHVLYSVAHFFLTRLEDRGRAKLLFERCVQVMPYFPEALFSLGRLHFDAQEIDPAAELYQRALDSGIRDPMPVLYNLALAKWRQGRLEEAQDACRKMLERRPEDRHARELLEKIDEAARAETPGDGSPP